MKISTIFVLLTLLILTACASSGSSAPTPTIVRLDRSEIAEATSTTVVTDPTDTSLAEPIVISTATTTATATTSPVSPTTTATVAAAETGSIGQVEVVTTALYLRTGPGLEYETIGGAREGDQFAVTGISASGTWLQIVTAEGEPGWISAKADYTRLISAEADELPVIEAAATSIGVVETAALTPSGPTTPLTGDTGGGQLVFATSSGGDLYAVNIDGTGLQKLASGVIDPVVSPDGRQVAFTRWDGAKMGSVYVLNLADGSERVVANDIPRAKSPTWSDDGQALIISAQRGGTVNPPEECREFDADDGVNIPNDVAEITSFKITSENTSICFIRREDLQWGLRQIDLTTGASEDLATDLYSFSPTWDPQNPTRVIYDGERGLMQFDVATGDLQPFTDDVRDTAPVFSPDGQTLAMTYKQHDHWEVYTYDLASGARERLTKPPILADPQYSSAAPAWSPDGSQLAFVTDRSGQHPKGIIWEIWVMNADGSNQQPLLSSEVQTELGLQYNGVNERLLNWVGSSATPSATVVMSSAATVSATNVSLTGTWDFSFGTMSLTQQDARVKGTYEWYGGVDTGEIDGIVVGELGQFQGMWISDRSSNSQQLLRWQLAADYTSFAGVAKDGMTGQQWCGVRSSQSLPDGCGFSGTWQLHFGHLAGLTGQTNLVQTGQTVQGTFVDSEGHTGEIDGVVTVESTTEVKLTGTWRNDQGEEDSFEWRLDLTTGRTFQGRRDPGNSEWCGWREGSSQPELCGWED